MSDQSLASHGSHEVNVEIDGRKILFRVESPAEGDAHRSIRKGSENAPMHSSHWVMQATIDWESHRTLTGRIRLGRVDLEPNQLRNWSEVKSIRIVGQCFG